MGGHGSGRPPSIKTLVNAQRANIAQPTGGTPFELPNYSGMQNKLDTGEITTSVKLNDVENPDASKTFNLGNNKFLAFTSVDRTPVVDEGIFNFECKGNFTGDLVHIHQHTGNAGVGTIGLRIEGEDSDFLPLHLTANASTDPALYVETGRVGIGTAIPSAELDVSGSIHIPDTKHIRLGPTFEMSFNSGIDSDSIILDSKTSDAAIMFLSGGGFYADASGSAEPSLTIPTSGLVVLTSTSGTTNRFDIDCTNGVHLKAGNLTTVGNISGSNTYASGITNTAGVISSASISGSHIINTGDITASGSAYCANTIFDTADTPPAASGYTKGTIYVQYTA